MKAFWSFKNAEKLLYIVMVPSVLGYGAYAIYKKNFLEFEQRGQHIKKVEEKFLPENRATMIKLLNFKQRVFAIGLVDDNLFICQEGEVEDGCVEVTLITGCDARDSHSITVSPCLL